MGMEGHALGEHKMGQLRGWSPIDFRAAFNQNGNGIGCEVISETECRHWSIDFDNQLVAMLKSWNRFSDCPKKPKPIPEPPKRTKITIRVERPDGAVLEHEFPNVVNDEIEIKDVREPEILDHYSLRRPFNSPAELNFGISFKALPFNEQGHMMTMRESKVDDKPYMVIVQTLGLAIRTIQGPFDTMEESNEWIRKSGFTASNSVITIVQPVS